MNCLFMPRIWSTSISYSLFLERFVNVSGFTYWRCRYCGVQRPPTMTSTNNMMTVMFVSDRSVTTEGFLASYTTINATSGIVIIWSAGRPVELSCVSLLTSTTRDTSFAVTFIHSFIVKHTTISKKSSEK